MATFRARITFRERLKTRIPDWKRFVARARADGRNAAYDLLPLLDLGQRDALARLMAATRPKTAGLRLTPDEEVLARGLRNDGRTPLQPPVAANVLDGLTGYFRSLPCHDPYRPHLGGFAWDSPPSDEINIGYYTWEQALAAPGLLDLANQPQVLAVMEAVLGCKPLIDNIGVTWTYPGRETAKSVQRFHRDYDCARNIKVFWYLTEVTESSGPHVYVRGSHRSRTLDTGRAQTDEAIAAAFGEAAIERITGPAGSWFMEDVYGFHKGQLPLDAPRLMLAVQYNLYRSPHCPRDVTRLPLGARDPYVNRLVAA